MSKDTTEKEVMQLFRMRQKDREKAQTKRRKQGNSSPKPVKDLLTDLFQNDSQTLRHIQESRALLAWPEYVGQAGSEHSIALKIRGTRLIVFVSDPLWMQELSFLKNTILNKYKKDFPQVKIQEIFFTRSKT